MELEFGGRRREPDVRRLYDMTDVVYDKSWLAGSENLDLYYMYRDLYLSRSDRERLLEQGLRYDITIIPPRMLGSEYVKTAGHYHPLVSGGRVTYPEIYEVLEGEALYLLQKQDLSDVVAVSAFAGDKVLIPPDYGHITINRSNNTLKMAKFVAREFSSLYEPYRGLGGSGYFFTSNGWIKNDRYPEVAQLRRVDAPDSTMLRRLGMSRNKEMYPLMRKRGRMDYLSHPDKYPEFFRGFS